MVKGIETDDKKYKHKKGNIEKEMCEDMNVWKRYIQRDITKKRYSNEMGISSSESKKEVKKLTPVRVLQILILGIFGPITLIGGVYMFMKENNVVAIPLILIGAVFVIALFLNEAYRK